MLVVCFMSACSWKHKDDLLQASTSQQKLEKNKNNQVHKSAKRANAIYYFLQGKLHFEKEQFDKAIVLLQKVLELDPGKPHIHYLLGKSLLERGKFEEGIAHVKQAIKIDPDHREARLLLGSLYTKAKKHNEAEKMFLALIKENPEDEEAVMYQVLILIEREKYYLAERQLQKFLKRNPNSALGYFYLGLLDQELGKTKKAINHLKRALDIRPGFVQAGLFLARIFEAENKTEEAIEHYRKMALHTDNALFHKKLGELYLSKKQYIKARDSFLNYERLEGGDLNNTIKLGLLFIETKDYEQAIVRLKKILKQVPDNENIFYYLGVIYEERKDFAEALRYYSKITESKENYFDALKRKLTIMESSAKYHARGQKLLERIIKENKIAIDKRPLLFELGGRFFEGIKQRDKAIAIVDRGLQEFHQNFPLMYLKGSLLERADRHEEAITTVESILVLDPNHVGALNFVGYTMADHGLHLQKAERYIRKALKLKPNDPFIIDSLGWVLYQQGKYQKAHQALKKAFKAMPEETVIVDHLGDVLVKLGRIEEAKEYYELVIKLGVESEQIRKGVESKLLHLTQALQNGICKTNNVDPSCVPIELRKSKKTRIPTSTQSQ